MRRLEHPFLPVVDWVDHRTPKVLILGTFPSTASRKAGGYYGHPRNAFWKLFGDILPPYLPLEYCDWETRYQNLRENRIALWDVAKSALREGDSSDSKLRDVIPNDIGRFLDRNPNIRAIIFNGKTAKRLFQESFPWFPGKMCRLRTCPSTSAAHAISYATKLRAWRSTVRKALIDNPFPAIPSQAREVSQ